MFWLYLAMPFIALALAASIARRGVVVRFAAVLAAIFFLVDAAAFIALLSKEGSSTDTIGLGIIAMLELAISVVLLIASPFALRKNRKSEKQPMPQ